LGGNDDCGQMSAWYLFSAMGFYPVAPGNNMYSLGSPLVDKAEITLEKGNLFTVETVNQSKENVYVSKVELNGKEIKDYQIRHSDIINGGTLTFYMSDKAKK